MNASLLFVILAGAARAEITAASLPAAKGPSSESQRAAAVQLWKMGMGYFAEGDWERARAMWFSCGSLDASNEDCRRGLMGLDRLGGARSAAAPAAKDAAAAQKPASQPATADPAANKGPQAAQAPSKDATLLLARATAEENKRSSLEHWNMGLGYYQKGDLLKARDEWALCNVLDSKNSDCLSGLKKVEVGMGSDDRQEAIRHWNAGIAHFQKGDLAKAREEWQSCHRYDPQNLDCQTGIQRIDQTYGAPR